MDSEYKALYDWIAGHAIARWKWNICGNISHDFANAILLVEILKEHYPEMVQLRDYSPKNTYAQKLINWHTVNKKVLKKLKIYLTQTEIEQLASAKPGIVEKLLLEIKNKIDMQSETTQKETPKQVISEESFNKMKANLEERIEAITILENKLNHLENLLKRKDESIKNLTTKVQYLKNRTVKPESRTSKFFGFF